MGDMNLANNWQDDQDYQALIADLMQQPAVQKLSEYTQHHHSDRLTHSLKVSYTSYKIAQILNWHTKETARAGLLHDLFYYDWRTVKFNGGSHAYMHPRIALNNAKHLTNLSDREADIIINHMWGATMRLPRYKESFLVSLVDDYCALAEFFEPMMKKVKHLVAFN